MSSVCATLEPVRSKVNKIPEVSVLQNFSPHALFSRELKLIPHYSFRIGKLDSTIFFLFLLAPTLEHLCREVLTKCLNEEQIEELVLPPRIKQFLKYEID